MYARRFISVIASALSVGVCVYITYISRDVDAGTLLFNLGFLTIMLLMLIVVFFTGLLRLMKVSRGLKDGIQLIRNGGHPKSELLGGYPLFQNDYLDECYLQYCRMARENPDTSCDIRTFINEDAVDSYIHRSILELVPDILTSLGILGTFVGLVMGLREFDPSSYEQMAGSVTPLINGIKVAFMTSIYGISLSLSFSFNLRSECSNLTSLMDEFLETFYMNVQPPYEQDSLSRLLEHQKGQDEMAQELTELFVQQMGKSFEQAITPAFNRMTNSINHIVSAFTENQEEVLINICDTVSRQMRAELANDFAQISKSMAELEKAQEHYTDFMDRSMMRMQQTFTSMQEHMSQTEKYNADSMEKLAKAQQEAYRVTQEQKATYQEYIRFMYQTIEKFSAVWDKNSERLQEYSDEIASMGPVQSNLELKASLNRVSTILQDMQKRQLAAELSDMISLALRKLDALEESVNAPRLFGSRRKKQS